MPGTYSCGMLAVSGRPGAGHRCGGRYQAGTAEGPGRDRSPDLTIRGLEAARASEVFTHRRAHGQLGGYQVKGGGDAQAVVQAGGHRGWDRWRLA
jgi:hypothetical protein